MPLKPLFDCDLSLFPRDDRKPVDSAQIRRARAANRDSQWRADMARAYAYTAGRARTDDEAQAAETAYAEALEAGPDFARYRRDSDFAPPPRLSMDRNALARLRFKLHALYKGSWATKEKGKHAGLIQRTTLAVFDALCALAARHGQVFPSLVGLAWLAKCSRNTVIAALKQLEFFGFITVHRRIKRIKTALGFRTVQDTNAYSLQEPNSWAQMALSIFGLSSKPASESNKRGARNSNFFINNEKGQNSTLLRRITDPWQQLKDEWDAI